MLRSKICIAVTKSIGTLKLHPDKPDIISEIKKHFKISNVRKINHITGIYEKTKNPRKSKTFSLTQDLDRRLQRGPGKMLQMRRQRQQLRAKDKSRN